MLLEEIMDNNLTEMVFVIDMSGSMSGLESDTIGGFNSIIEEQKKINKEKGHRANVTTILFDDKYEVLHNGINIDEIKPMTDNEYVPRGMTALLDATGKAINVTGDRLRKMDEDKRPGKINIFVITDGGENASREFSGSQIKDMIKHQENKYNWCFNFMGANQDSFTTAKGLGISAHNVANYSSTSLGTRSAYGGMAKRLRAMASFDLSEGQSYPEQVVACCASLQSSVNDATNEQ